MGKGTIISEAGDGQYSVSLNYAGRERVAARIEEINTALAALVTQIEATQQEIE